MYIKFDDLHTRTQSANTYWKQYYTFNFQDQPRNNDPAVGRGGQPRLGGQGRELGSPSTTPQATDFDIKMEKDAHASIRLKSKDMDKPDVIRGDINQECKSLHKI